MNIFKLAITGSAGSGKSVVCNRLSDLGWPMFDCDRIARQVVEPGQKAYDQMVDLFGKQCVGADGSLDRAKLRSIILGSDSLRREMEEILHPAILTDLDEKIKATALDHQMVAVEVPLLFELNMEERFDYCVTVAVDRSQMVERIISRDNVTRESAEKILDLQMDLDEKIKRSDHVIWNNGGIKELLASVDGLDNRLKKDFLTIYPQ